MWGYRRELRQTRTQLYFLIFPSIVGGIAGAVLLRQTPPGVFARLVPFLILFATILFMLQATVQRWLRVHQHQHDGARWLAGAAAFQFGVAVYGGYFGAGIGILMLAALSLLGLTDIHQMNGLKNLVCALHQRRRHGLLHDCRTGGVARCRHDGSGSHFWGLWRSRPGAQAGSPVVRRTVIAIGFAMTISLFFKQS